MYEKNGQHLEVILRHLIKATFVRPKERPYKTDNKYVALKRFDGYSGFVFSTAQGKLYQASAVNQPLHRMQKAYNDMEEKRAKAEKREPELIPSFSAHNLRHTFCTRFCENETNIKVIQEVMGHKDVQTTLDIYAESTTEKKQEVINSLQGKIIIK